MPVMFILERETPLASMLGQDVPAWVSITPVLPSMAEQAIFKIMS